MVCRMMCNRMRLAVLAVCAVVGSMQWPGGDPSIPQWTEPVGIDCLCSDVSPRVADTETVNTTCPIQKAEGNCGQPFMLNSVKELPEGALALALAADRQPVRRISRSPSRPDLQIATVK